MPKVKLTKTFVRTIKCVDGKAKTDYFDIVETGLMLEVRKSGTKTYYYRHSVNGKVKQRKLADTQSLTLNRVREIVKRLKHESSCSNNLILNTFHKKQRKTITVEKFYTNYYLPFIKENKKSCRSDISYFNKHILPFWSNIPLDELTSEQISNKHLSLKRNNKLANSSCNKLLKYLSRMYNLAIDLEIQGVNVNPTAKIKQFKEDNKVERFLCKQEIQRLIEILDKQSNPNIKPIILMLLLTGARMSEVLNAQYKDIDLKNRLWTIPLTKNNKVRRIPISPKLEKVIRTIPKNQSSYLFVSPVTNRPYKKLQSYWEKIREEANLHDVRLHDLRHTFASNLVNQGVSLYEVQNLLGHSDIKMTQRYAHLSNQSLYDAACLGGSVVDV